MYPRIATAALVAVLISATAAPADAQVPRRPLVVPSASFVQAGVMEFGVSGLFLLNYDKTGDDESLRFTLRGGLSFAYFLRDALSLHFEIAGGYFKQDAPGIDASEATFQVDAMVNYYLGIGRGLFWKPGIGLGFRTGTRADSRIEQGLDITARSSILGGHVRVDLGLAFFSSPIFNLKAGPELFFSFGGIDPDDGSPNSGFFRVDGGFSLGAYYVF